MARRVLKEVRSVYGKDKWTKAVIKSKLVFLAQASNTRWFHSPVPLMHNDPNGLGSPILIRIIP